MQGTPKEVHILEKSLETFKKSLETMQIIDEIEQDAKESLLFSGEEVFGRLRSKLTYCKSELQYPLEGDKPPTDWESWFTAIEKDILEV